MASETLSAKRRMDSPAATVFAVLADPTSHADIDGTGWVCEPLDRDPLTGVGQRFRMAMHHEQHPDKDYEMTNEVAVFDASQAISWRPGQPDDDGIVRFGGWMWRYDLDPVDAGTTDVTLTYDWSAATSQVREFIQFPPFGPDHLDNSLNHLAELAAER